MPPLTAAEAMRAEEVLAEIHTSASDVGGASSISMLCEPESCLLPSLDCPEWALVLGDCICRRQQNTLYQSDTYSTTVCLTTNSPVLGGWCK